MNLYKKISPSFLAVCLLFSATAYSGQKNDNEKSKANISVSAKTGFSYMVTEMYRDFSGSASEFNNQPGLYSGMEISHFITSALEAGGGISLSVLKGEIETPSFSALGFDHYIKNIKNEAVAYSNRLYGPEVFGRYHIGRNGMRTGKINFFLKAGAGLLFNESELFYVNRQGDEIIFGKGYGQSKTTKVINGFYILGSGFNYVLSKRISLKMAANINMVGYDMLDVVHNYDEAGTRRKVIGFFTDLTTGIAIRLTGGEKTASANHRKVFPKSHLPFSAGQ